MQQLERWQASNPNYHAVVETMVGAGVMSRTEVFVFEDGSAGRSVKLKSDIFSPNPVKYIVQRHNGELLAYFPRTDQFISVDVTNQLSAVPGWSMDVKGAALLLKTARNAFVETNPGVQVVTLALAPGTLELPDSVGEVYVSFRLDTTGKLLGVEQMALGHAISSTVRYLTFNQAQVMHDAPSLPEGRVPSTSKTLKAAIDEEMSSFSNRKPGTSI